MSKKVLNDEKPDKERSKQRILNAAINMFSKYSYEKATFKMISEETGLSEALIVKYFGTKRDLALAVASKINDDFFTNASLGKEHDNLHDELHALGQSLIDWYSENRVSFFALITLSKQDNLFIKDLVDNISAISPNTERLNKFQKKGEIPADFDLDLVYQQIVTVLHAQIFYTMLCLTAPMNIIQGQVSILVDMMLHGLSDKNSKYFTKNVGGGECFLSPTN